MRIEPIVTILAVALVANVVLVVLLVAVTVIGRRRRARPPSEMSPATGAAAAGTPAARQGSQSMASAGGGAATSVDAWGVPVMMDQQQNEEGAVPRRFPIVFSDEDARTDRTIESFLSSPEEELPGRPGASGRASGTAGTAESTPDPGPAVASGPTTAVAVTADPLVDPTTGLESAAAWDRMLGEESARLTRYRRPATIVIAELEGLPRLTERFGPEPGNRLVPAVADALRRNARAADRIAYLGNGRFLALLPETDEIQAINYVERVRVACDRWLESGAVALRLALGWASPANGVSLETAVRTAEDRLYAERRRIARTTTGGNAGG